MIRTMATTTVRKAPIAVSTFPNLMSFSFSPLSTTELCWKKSIHGAMVVPMLAISMKNNSLVNPPGGSVRDEGVLENVVDRKDGSGTRRGCRSG